jgi:hypothetical protein
MMVKLTGLEEREDSLSGLLIRRVGGERGIVKADLRGRVLEHGEIFGTERRECVVLSGQGHFVQ